VPTSFAAALTADPTLRPQLPLQGSTDPNAQVTPVGKGLGGNNFTATDAARNQVSYALIITGVT